jgi:diaminopimelate epimerase
MLSFPEDIAVVDVERDGRALRYHSAFALRNQRQFCQVLTPQSIAIRNMSAVEENLACGTGLCRGTPLQPSRRVALAD